MRRWRRCQLTACRACSTGTFPLVGDANNLQARGAEVGLQANQVVDALQARQAARGPEVEQDELSLAIAAKLPGRAGLIEQSEVVDAVADTGAERRRTDIQPRRRGTRPLGGGRCSLLF